MPLTNIFGLNFKNIYNRQNRIRKKFDRIRNTTLQFAYLHCLFYLFILFITLSLFIFLQDIFCPTSADIDAKVSRCFEAVLFADFRCFPAL